MDIETTQDPLAPSAGDSVRVSVRVRPLNAREKAAAAESKTSWSISSSFITQLVGEKPIAANSFSFDHVFEPHVTNEQVYTALAKPVVMSATEGINSVIFAYGQTAAGKTYTMLGTQTDPGVTRRSISAVFDLISAQKNRQFLLRASYIEIYNEIIRDLLAPDNDNLKIHEDVISKRVFVESREEVVTSVNQVMDIIARGETARAVGVTNMNDRSSRSHTIFSLKIESREMSLAETDGRESATDDGIAVRASTLSLVDLAGSERASFTKAQGMRLVEGGHINKSLLTLGTVINKLSSGESRSSAHIPYRDSKLTRLLQPALGGNARTAIVCAVTPAILHMEETLSTLKFASRAKRVTNNAKTNEFLDDRAKLRRAEKEIAMLKSECQRLKTGAGSSESASQDTHLPAKLPSETHQDRVGAFEKKFQVLLRNVCHHGSTHKASGHTRKRKYSDMASPALTDALNLFGCQETKLGEMNSMGKSSEEALSDLRRKLLEAEKQMRQDQSAINYERQAMISEVEELVHSTDQADRARRAAERECYEATTALGQAQVASIVDEIVSEAMSISFLSQDLRQAQSRLAELNDVSHSNKTLQEDLSALQKEHAEVVKREKRGMGPVLKEVKLLQGKIGDLEKKHRTLREKLTKTTSEKGAVERELKNLERQNKGLSSEVERHRSHTSKGQNRINKELIEEKRRFEASVKGMKEEISMLTGKLREGNDEAGPMFAKLAELENEISELRVARENLLGEQIASSTLLTELRTKMHASEATKNKLMQEVEEFKSKGESALQEIAVLTDEVGKAHLELEETKSELSKILERVESTESARGNLVCAKEEAEKKCVELKKDKDELLALLSSEKADKENLLRELARKEENLVEQRNVIMSLEEYIEKYKTAQELTKSELVTERDTSKELNVKVAQLERLMEEMESRKRLECNNLRAQLVSTQENKRSDGKENRPTSHVEVLRSQEPVVNDASDRKEIRELHEQVEKLIAEIKIRTREVLKLSETIQSRDRRIYCLEDTLDQLRRGEGVIATLEQRVRRRDVMIKDLSRRLDVQTALLEKSMEPDVFLRADRVLQAEAKYAAVLEERQQQEELVDRFEKERLAMVQEARKLREKLKEKDIGRVREAVQRKDAKHEEVRRKNEVLLGSSRPVPRKN